MRRPVALFVTLLVLVGLVVVADAVAVRVTERTVAVRLQEAGGLATTPEVEVRGWPFLTQALRGRYEDVVVRARDAPAGQLRISSFVAQLTGLRVPLGEVLSGSVQQVPVERVTARAVITYADLTAAVAPQGLRVSADGPGLVRVTGSVQVLGRAMEATAVSRPTLDGTTLVVTAERFEVGNGMADAVLSRGLGNRFDFRIDLGALPYGLQLTGLVAANDGVVLTASATDAVLAAH